MPDAADFGIDDRLLAAAVGSLGCLGDEPFGIRRGDRRADRANSLDLQARQYRCQTAGRGKLGRFAERVQKLEQCLPCISHSGILRGLCPMGSPPPFLEDYTAAAVTVATGEMNNPELLPRWLLGPPGWSMVVCEIDLKVGGAFRHVWRRKDGTEMGMRGVYREIVPPERIVRTESFDDYPGESLASVVLTEQGGKTTLTLTVLYPSKEVRDATLASGMERGVAASYDRLAELLARQRFGATPRTETEQNC